MAKLQYYKLYGGIGNQLFQYAMYRYAGTVVPPETVGMDLNSFNPHQSGTVADYFPIERKQADAGTIRYFHRNGLWHALRITDRLGLTGANYYREEDLAGRDLTEILKQKRVYLRGYWQKSCYASAAEEILRKELDLSGALDDPALPEAVAEKNRALLERIESSESVAVHVRGGDYITHAHSYGGICTEEYYRSAVEKICGSVADPEFFLFTNDEAYLQTFRSAWEGKKVCLAEGNDEEHGHLDLYLMSRCKHHIIANSSFSYWGAWLGKHPGQNVILPKRWDSERDSAELALPGWIRIGD